MKVSDAINSRKSVRAFLDTPVSGEVLRRIIETAKRAPSGGNVQPWHVYVVGGRELIQFRELIQTRMADNPMAEGTEYEIYPPKLKEPYRSRRFKVGEDMYKILGIPREDKTARLMNVAKNYTFFGAPAAMFFAIDRTMQEGQWADLGMFLENIMLLAREEGLDTCAQEAWARWHKTLNEYLEIPEELMFFCGLAIGYADDADPINALETDRAPLGEFATFKGI